MRSCAAALLSSLFPILTVDPLIHARQRGGRAGGRQLPHAIPSCAGGREMGERTGERDIGTVQVYD